MHRNRGLTFKATACLLLLAASALPAVAEVVRFEISAREPFADGKSFGDVGPYERIVGRVAYEIDPAAECNAPVVDLALAPRNERGMVEFSGDLFILAPTDLAKSNGNLFYDVNNRGIKLALRFLNDAAGNNDPRTPADAGNGFLMRQGYIVVWSGWDGELLPAGHLMRMLAPVARGSDGPITGLVRCEVVPDRDIRRTLVTRPAHGTYRPTRQGIETATLTHRELVGDPRVPIPRDQWKLHVTERPDAVEGELPVVELEMAAGFKQGHIYELIYEAQDPLVHGVCYAGLRDLIAALKQGRGAGNPLLVDGRPAVERAYGFGVSQSARFLREFLHAGFNRDEAGGKVFDGMIPHVSGAGLGSFNHRFAQPTRHNGQHDHHDYPLDRFPFAYETQKDPLTGEEDGILRSAISSGTAPLVMHTQSAAEYWTRSGSLVHTDPLGARDAKLPPQVRLYQFGGTQHGPSAYPPERGIAQNLANPGDYRPFLRALLVALDRWVQEGTSPPPSVYPTIADKTLVDWDQASTGFPQIPGVRYPEVIQQPPRLDLGPRWKSQRIIDHQPPKVAGHYRVLAARCGADGNELGCLLPPEVAAPVATYTGWNLRRKDVGAENQLVSLVGSYIPLPVTRAERVESGDARQSLEERYGTLERYIEELQAACDRLEKAGYLLPEDSERIQRAQRERVAPRFATSEP